jgi:hypothetical protein
MNEEAERLTQIIETAYEEFAQQLKNPWGVEDLHVYIMERINRAKQYTALLIKHVGEQEAKRICFEKFDTAFKKIEWPDARTTPNTRISTREEG